MNVVKIIEIENLTESTFRLRMEKPEGPIKAGQCFSIGVTGSGVNREYSIYSSPNAPYLDILIKRVEGGVTSNALGEIRPGDAVEIDGPYGEFCIDEAIGSTQHFLFLATGTGIAPFHSFVLTHPNINYTIVHGVRHLSECYDADDYEKDRYIPCISQNSNGIDPYRVTDHLKKHPIDPASIVYLCGNRNMIIDAFEILRAQGVPGDNLYTEVFF